jgi:murein DD-endopeptidase MepM/ murein hydrolase activator NlpD
VKARALLDAALSMLGLVIVAATSASADSETSVWPVTQGHVVAAAGKHRGIDIAAAEGTAVYAFRAGVVLTVDTTKGCGRRVLVRHADMLSIYCNLTDVSVAEGDNVAAGAPLARIAAPAPKTRAHLHFELQSEGANIDPLSRLPRKSAGG